MIVSNPVFVPANSQYAAWERAVDTLHDFHFPISRENRMDGVIETDYRVGANVIELWHADSVGLSNRMESTLQSIRRKVKLDLTPVEGGYLVGVEAYKEHEDLKGIAESSTGASTFRKNSPLERNLTVVGCPRWHVVVGEVRGDLADVAGRDVQHPDVVVACVAAVG